jgi:AcrR family transcriptional regulator
MPPTARRQRRQELSREEILDAALGLAREGGWEAVTMRAIAQRVDASAAYTYRYFEARDAILLALTRRGFAQLLDSMRTAADTTTDPADALRKAKHAYVAFALEHPELYQVMYGLGGVRIPAHTTHQEGAAIGDLDARLLSRLSGRPPEEHTEDVLVLWAAVHGLITLADSGRIDQPINAPGGPVDRVLTDTLTRIRAQPKTPTYQADRK